MNSKITKKVEGGKLLRLEVEVAEQRLKSIRLTGDFFIHPEDSLLIIEKALLMSSPDADAATLANSLSELAKSQGIQMLGITPAAISETFVEAVRRARESGTGAAGQATPTGNK